MSAIIAASMGTPGRADRLGYLHRVPLLPMSVLSMFVDGDEQMAVSSPQQGGGTRVKKLPQAVPTVQVDNERVRVTEWRFAPGAETGVHIHQLDYTVVPLSDGRLQIVSPQGE